MTTSTMKMPASYSKAGQGQTTAAIVYVLLGIFVSGASSIINNVNVIYQSFVSLNSLLGSFGK